jgi:signal transduction histidine kinase/DNA-binding response OmpR family regulator
LLEKCVFVMFSSTDRQDLPIKPIATQPELLDILSKHAGNLIAIVDATGQTLYQSCSHQEILGYLFQSFNQTDRPVDQSGITVSQPKPNQVMDSYCDKIHPADRQQFRQAMVEVSHGFEQQQVECRFMHVSGSWLAFETTIMRLDQDESRQNDRQSPPQLLICSKNINDLKLADRVIRARDARIKNLFEQDRLIAAIADRIHQSQHLDDILATTVTELRYLLRSDRVVIYRFNPDGTGQVIVESVAEPWKSVLGVTQDCAVGDLTMMRMRFARGEPSIINNVERSNLSSCHCEFLKNINVQANLIVPIVLKQVGIEPRSQLGTDPTNDKKRGADNRENNVVLDPGANLTTNNASQLPDSGDPSVPANPKPAYNPDLAERVSAKLNNLEASRQFQQSNQKLWGLIIAHQCSAPRNWSADSVALLQKLSHQVAIAIMQADLLAKERSQQLKLAQQNLVLESAFQRIKNATESKRQFLANVSHEIRTPMNGIVGIAELLASTELDSQQLNLVRTIQASGQNLLQIINDILDYSRSQAKEISLVKGEFNLVKCIEEVVDLAAIQSHRKGLEVFSYIDPTLPHILIGDVGRLRQVLTNLVTNAIKFTSAGHITISVQRQPEQLEVDQSGEITAKQNQTGIIVSNPIEPNLTLKFTVTDTGSGISEANQQELFQPFTQFNPEANQKHGGTGLGLTISKQIVGAMNGKIGMSSTLGEGSSFWFELSLPIANAAAPAPLLPEILQAANITLTEHEKLKQLKVLVVADHPQTLITVNQHAQLWQLNLDRVSDPTAAIAMLKQAADRGDAYDLAILDLQLTQVSGEVLGYGILEDPGLAQTKLAIAAFVNQTEITSRLIKQGFAAALIKPFKISSLIKCLHQATNLLAQSNKINEHDLRHLKEQQTQTDLAEAAQFQPQPLSQQLDISNAAEPVESIAATNNQQQSAIGKISKPKILVVEDNQISQTLVTIQLQQLGYDSDCVSNGQEAIAKLAQASYPIVLMDCQMPVMDGYVATQEIRRNEAEAQNSGTNLSPTIIIATTANAFEEDRQACLEVGMDDFLKKPVMKKDLATMLDRWSAAIENQNSQH